MQRRWLIGLLLLVSTGAQAESARLRRLSPWARQSIDLRRAVRGMQQKGQLHVAHPEVASRLSADLSKTLKREVRIPARRIVQVEWGSAQHQALRQLLGSTVGIGMYPAKRWGHNKLRIGDLITDAVPKSASPFPSTGTKARMVPMNGMHHRFYEAVFVGEPAQVRSLQGQAAQLVQEKREIGMNCTSFISRLLRDQLKQSEASGLKAYGGKLEAFKASEWRAGSLWKKAAGANPALIIVYTPPGDYRSINQPGFKFDYAL